jgi:hypothetical protein
VNLLKIFRTHNRPERIFKKVTSSSVVGRDDGMHVYNQKVATLTKRFVNIYIFYTICLVICQTMYMEMNYNGRAYELCQFSELKTVEADVPDICKTQNVFPVLVI